MVPSWVVGARKPQAHNTALQQGPRTQVGLALGLRQACVKAPDALREGPLHGVP